jgi:hypothetical protein
MDWSPGRRPSHITLEDLYGAVAQHYDQPWLSMRAGMWRYMVAPEGERTDPDNSSTWSFHSFYPDNEDVHPNDLGRCWMGCRSGCWAAECLVWCLGLTVLSTPLSRPCMQPLDPATCCTAEPCTRICDYGTGCDCWDAQGAATVTVL